MTECPCVKCQTFREWCLGTINARVSYQRSTGLIDAQRLVAPTDSEPGVWEDGGTVRVDVQKEAE